MAFRFRKSFKIAPGIRINIGKKGFSSIGLGPRGASMSIGNQGKHANIGMPGTGISFRHKLDGEGNTREQQRLLKAQKKLEKAELRQEALSKVTLSLNENGSINILNAFNESLSRTDIKLMWEQQSDTILEWLENEMDEINGDVELLANIYQDTSNPNNYVEYKAKEYDGFKPNKPIVRTKLKKKDIPSLGFFANLFKSKREEHAEQIEESENNYQKKLEEWEYRKKKENKQYKEDFENWAQKKKEYDIKEKYYEENFSELINSDIDFMENLLENVFNSLSWLRETFVSYEIDNSNKIVWIDVDLPEIEDLPQKVASIGATGRKLNIKNKSKKQLQLEYAKHIHGIVFRLVGFVFTTLSKTENIIISGYSQRLDKATGKTNDDYLFSYKIDRDGFSRIDFNALDKVDPIEALNTFEHRKKMTTTGIFKEVDPFGRNELH